MARMPAKSLFFLLIGLALLSVTGCRESPPPTPTLTSTVTHTPTITPTPTITQTTTPAFTITPRPSNTFTATLTPFRTLSPTPSPSQAPLQPAVLFPYQDANRKIVDWSYIHVTRIDRDRLGEINDLWVFMAFQLMDRAVHQRNLNIFGEMVTVYYLNVAHEFDGVMVPMQLVLGGTPGANVLIKDIPAGGTAYLQIQVRKPKDNFDPYITHRDANRAYELRDSDYPLLFLKDFQAMLTALPDEIILLADHPILFPRDDWLQVKLDMRRVSYLAARYHPFFEIDAYDRLTEQSAFAYALVEHIFRGGEIPEGYHAFSSQTLIIITGDGQATLVRE